MNGALTRPVFRCLERLFHFQKSHISQPAQYIQIILALIYNSVNYHFFRRFINFVKDQAFFENQNFVSLPL